MSLLNNLTERMLRAGYIRLASLTSFLILNFRKTPGRLRRWNFCRGLALFQKNKINWKGKKNFPIYVINRKCDIKRLSSFLKIAHRMGIEAERVDAMNAKDPEFDWSPHDPWIADTFYGSEEFPKGTIGCFLSHLVAWEKVAAGRAEGALICEDDAILVLPLPGKWSDFEVPADADFVFCNWSLAEGLFEKKRFKGVNDSFQFIPVFEVLKERFQSGFALDGAGAYCYLLTKRCATKIVTNPKKFKLFMCIDWQIIFSSLSDAERQELFQIKYSGHFKNVQKHLYKLFTSYVMIPPLAIHWGSDSVINMSDRSQWIHRTCISHLKTKKN